MQVHETEGKGRPYSIRRRRHLSRVALFGWATADNGRAIYAARHPDKISALLRLNSLYRGRSKHPFIGHGSDMADPADANRFIGLSPQCQHWSCFRAPVAPRSLQARHFCLLFYSAAISASKRGPSDTITRR
jgi:hypothetical protein